MNNMNMSYFKKPTEFIIQSKKKYVFVPPPLKMSLFMPAENGEKLKIISGR